MQKKNNRGKRRHGAPVGYMTSTEAIQKLGKMLYRHVNEGRVRKIVPEGFKQGYYHIGDVEAILATEQYFSGHKPGDYRNHPSSTFALATEEDMPTIFDISARIFSDPPPLETRLAWLRKNPETFHVLRDQTGMIKGFSSLLPMRRDTLERFIRDEIESEQIAPDDVEMYAPGEVVHLYIMALAIDPSCTTAQKHTYGARLVNGLFSFLFELAQRGVTIETITARTYKPDGLRLLRKLGFPQLRSPVADKNLFAVRIAESGMPLFIKYSELLGQWKKENAPHRTASRSRPLVTASTSDRPDIPNGWYGWTPFIERHGVSAERRQIMRLNKSDYCHEGEYMQASVRGKTLVKCALDPFGQGKLLTQLWSMDFQAELRTCDVESCPCHEVFPRTLF